MWQTLAIALPAAFVAGVAFHKFIVSEAQAIKAHVTAESDKLRADVADALKAAASKI